MATVWLDQQSSSNLETLKPRSTKRKRVDHDNISNKRKVIINSIANSDSEDDDRLALSPRVTPVMPKITKSSRFIKRSLSSMSLFKCQLCRRCLKNKDVYLDHMILCSVERQASIKIVRAEKDKMNDKEHFTY